MKTRVLIADDSAFFGKMLQDIATRLGLDVVAVGRDGAEALELFKTHKPDLVLLDVTMPNMSGKECLSAIMHLDPNARVVMISSLTDTSLVKECLTLGAKAWIEKANGFGENGVGNKLKLLIAELKLAA